jgi:hypothetical protein
MVCYDVNGNDFLFSSPGIDCSDKRYKSIMALSIIIFIVFSIGIPVFFMYKTCTDERTTEAIFVGGRKRYLYFTLITVVVRLFISIITVVPFSDDNVQNLLYAILNVTYLFISSEQEPFENERHNAVFNASLFFLTLLSTVLVTDFSGDENTFITVAISTLYVGPSIVLILYVVVERFKRLGDVIYCRERRKQEKKEKEKRLYTQLAMKYAIVPITSGSTSKNTLLIDQGIHNSNAVEMTKLGVMIEH